MKLELVTIQTKKQKESIDFYKESAGLKIQMDLRGKSPKNIVFMGNAAGEPCIELIDNPEAGYEGTGLSIGFHTDDVEKAREAVEAKGMNPTPVISPEPDVKFFFVKDPNGLDVQFIKMR